MSVIGLDVGNDVSVVAAVLHRGIDVILNSESSRETPSLVSFSPNHHRLIGSSSTLPSSVTISHLKRLLSKPYSSLHLPSFPFPLTPSPDGYALVQIKDRTFSPTQILAMLLSHLKKMAEKSLDSQVSNCVIGIPSYFTDLERRAYLEAAAIAGLRPLRLMHDCTATALGYGIYKQDVRSTSFVVFVDVGNCDTQVAVASFGSGKMRILAHASNRELGGRDFDEVLFRYFEKEFREKYHIEVGGNVRASVRLRTACEKLKRVLSANAEAPISVECLMEEKDVKGFIKREEFERLSAGLLERIVVPCRKAMNDARLTVDKIQSVELVGSGSRIPAIARVLTDFFTKEPSRTINASECVARGCALQCAMLSPVFRVRDYEVIDSFPYSVGFSTNEGSTSLNNMVFQKGQCIPSVKMLTFHKSQEFHIEANYCDPSELPPDVSQKINHCTIGPFQAPQNDIPKVKVRVHLNLHGIITITSASLIKDDAKIPVSKVATHTDNVNSEFNHGTSNNGPRSKSGRSHAEGFAEEVPMRDDKLKEGTHPGRVEIPVNEFVYGAMTKSDLLKAQELEHQLAHQDRVVEKTKEKKNALEAYVYEIRNKLFERYRSFASETEKDGISRNLQNTEEWLYEDGDDETENTYSSKMEELKKLIDPIENRCKEEEARAEATRELLKYIVDYRIAATSLPHTEVDLIISECNKAEQWLREKSQLQDSLRKDDNPILWSREIKQKMEELIISCQHIIRARSPSSRPVTSRSSRESHPPDGMQTD